MKKIIIFLIVLFLSYNLFSQTAGNGVTDIDGNQYTSVILGNQEFTQQNLSVTKYRNGDEIPQVTDPTTWANLTSGAWCYYANDSANGVVYGKLYNWYAVNDSRGLAPLGWHVITDSDWTNIVTLLGGIGTAGGKMKEAGTVHWSSPNTGGIDSSNFNGLPSGYRRVDGVFADVQNNCSWWSATEVSAIYAKGHYLYYNYTLLDTGSTSKTIGFAVRCANDNLLNNSQFETSIFSVYPNPASYQLTINNGNTNLEVWSYKIFNVLGQLIYYDISYSKTQTIILNSILDEGLYIVKIYDSSSNMLQTEKVLLRR